ncbi:MAG: hypothetical protein V1674_06255 [Candidatus Omnitrophota bacterium]
MKYLNTLVKIGFILRGLKTAPFRARIRCGRLSIPPLELRALARVGSIIFLGLVIFGCVSYAPGKFRGDFPVKEDSWIREGEPLIFENKPWHPTEDIEILLDSEMDLMGVYKNVPFYVEKRQIKPFDRIYSKFGNHRYRMFKQKETND